MSSTVPIFKTRGPLDPVNDSAIFAPRPELDQLMRAVNAPTVDAYIAILSSRQTGKTTLLYQLRQRVRPRGIGVALVDLALVRDQPEDQLYRFVAGEMRSELEPNIPRRADAKAGVPPKRDAAAPPSNPIEFRRFLLDLARQVRAPRILLLIDEVEGVPEKYSDAFFGVLRNVFSSRRKEDEAAFEKYLIVFCGSRELHRLTGGPNSPLNIADRVYLRDLSVDGIRFLTANFARIGITAPPETADWLFAQTGGHPYLTQKLCALIEHWRPPSITPEIVQRAAAETLRSDDHLEKLVIQVDEEPPARDVLREIVAGTPVSFSRLKPPVARLELLGAIKEVGQQCVVRNALYLAAFRAHFGLPSAETPPGGAPRPWARYLIAIAALVIFLINVPFLYFYTTDILLASRSVNDRFALDAPDAIATIHYDRILRANTAEASVVRVEVENPSGRTPYLVDFRKQDADLTLRGSPQRQFDPPYHEEDFPISLNLSGVGALPYNPFQPYTSHRRVELEFSAGTPGSPPVTHTLDFRVDFYSAAIISTIVSIGSALAFIAGLWGNVQRLRQGLKFIGRLSKSAAE
jgi:hypothetical protein